jgi:hypothetical protein
MPPCASSASEPASAAAAIVTSRSAPELGRAAKRLWTVAVDDLNILRGYLRGPGRESPRRRTHLHAMGTEKFPSRGVFAPPWPP